MESDIEESIKKKVRRNPHAGESSRKVCLRHLCLLFCSFDNEMTPKLRL